MYNLNISTVNTTELEEKTIRSLFDESDFRLDEPTNLLFFKIVKLDNKYRLELRKILSKNIRVKIVLISNDRNVAALAWKIPVFQFMESGLDSNELSLIKRKLINEQTKRIYHEKLRVSFKGGFHLIHPDEILVAQGKGNYCKIYFKNQKPELLTVRLSNVRKRLVGFNFVISVNQSLLLNINHLRKIQDGVAFFKGKEIINIKLSKKSSSVLRKKLLWL